MQLMKGKPTLVDVDGRELGKVQLVSIKLVEGFDDETQQHYAYFEEEPGKDDPYLRAEGLKLSIEDDWPEHYWAIIGNWRARYLQWVRTLQQRMPFLGEEAWTPEAYIATFK